MAQAPWTLPPQRYPQPFGSLGAPKKTKSGEIDLSLRFRFGIHTIFLLVSPLTTFDDISVELLSAIRERYPRGLSSSRISPNDTPIPGDGEEVIVVYGALASRHNLESWRDLKIQGSETPVSKSIKDGTDIAFLVRTPDEEDDPVKFVVEWPRLDDDDDEDEEQ
ncbi:hypothetical protein PoMZ_06142 [Pyricularia oryzae]|uniref:Uncharacterized protein n=1 Tax=Pyricularia oryzae TaxID=318829 RepID=A0A4P7NQ00_PYROR|nr:hypothetical protein PoMZ_06142 [Pyricularia oryzae]